MERGRTGQRYILGGENLSFQVYLSRIAAVAGVPEPRIGLPYAAMFPFAATGNVMGRVFPQLFRDVNVSVLDSAFLEHYVSSAKASRELAFEVSSIDQAIRDGIRWFVECGYMKLVSGVLVPGAPRTLKLAHPAGTGRVDQSSS
jgi:dihydroflavonol-4-reductase